MTVPILISNLSTMIKPPASGGPFQGWGVKIG